MQNPQSDNPTITKLLEADAHLAAQEVELSAQLASIQTKRHSLKTVIDMFAPVDTSETVPVATPAQTPIVEKAVESTTSNVVVPELNSAPTETTAEALVASTPPKRQAKKNSSPASSKQGKKSTSTREPSKNTNDWRQYVKDDLLTRLSLRL